MILLATSFGKAASLIAHPKRATVALAAQNAAFPLLSERTVLWAGTCLEVLVILVLIRAKSDVLRYGTLLWLCGVFALYRLVLAAIGKPACHCSGFFDFNEPLVIERINLLLLGVLFAIGAIGFSAGTIRALATRSAKPPGHSSRAADQPAQSKV
jgi:hypothetical protein